MKGALALLSSTLVLACVSLPSVVSTPYMARVDISKKLDKALTLAYQRLSQSDCQEAIYFLTGGVTTEVPQATIYQTDSWAIFESEDESFYMEFDPSILAATVCGAGIQQGSGIYMFKPHLRRASIPEIVRTLIHEYGHWAHCHSTDISEVSNEFREKVADSVVKACY